MKELELLDVHPDHTHLVLTDCDGERYRLPINDDLREALRPERATLESVKVRLGKDAPSVRDIQSLIRMGSTAGAIAEQFGLPVEHVERYEGPILNERRFIAQRARTMTIGPSSDSPTLEDLVLDRLAARGVDSASVEWDAVRQGNEPWEIIARFIYSAQQKEARWSVDSTFQHIHALDQEGRWLTETVSPIFGSDAPRPEPADDEPIRPQFPSVGSDALISELNAKRGIRVEPDMSMFDEDELLDEVEQEEVAASSVEENEEGDVLPFNTGNQMAAEQEPRDDHDEPTPDDQPNNGPTLPGFEQTPKKRKSKKRTSVPPFDEIFFGSRSD